jgi:hypothetical protein
VLRVGLQVSIGSLCHLIGFWQGSNRIAYDPSSDNPNKLLNLIFAEWYAILQNDDGNRSRRRPKSLTLDKFA